MLDFLETGRFDPDTLYRAGWIDIADGSHVNDPDLSDVHADNPEPYCGSSGDFIFCSASLFNRVGGFREDLTFTNTHKDSIFCWSAFDQTGRIRKIGNTYHLNHDRPGHFSRRIEYRWQKVSRRRQKSSGLDDGSVISATSDRITKLTLPDHLLQIAQDKQPVEPKVPRPYRLKRPSLFRQPGKSLLRLLDLR